MSVLQGDQPTHHGGGMTTRHQVPWLDDWQDFEAAMASIRQGKFDPETYGVDPGETFDRNKWRYWNVAYSIRHAVDQYRSTPSNVVLPKEGRHSLPLHNWLRNQSQATHFIFTMLGRECVARDSFHQRSR